MPTPLARRREPCQAGPLAIVAAAATILLLGLAARAGSPSAVAVTGAPTWRGVVGERATAVSTGQRSIVVLKAPSLANHVAVAGGRASEVAERAWTDDALKTQKELLSRISLQDGVTIQPEFTYTRVLNGFSAALSPTAVAALERSPQVAGVFPVRVGYPASVPAPGTVPARPLGGGVMLPGFDGHGATVALLDTGVDRAHPYLAGRVRRGYDIVAGDDAAAAEPNPLDPSTLESHGTELAGLLVGQDGPGGLHGVAPGATVFPIRVAGWQRTASGGWAVYGRTDQVIAGLERAVDPNGDGDSHDGARVTLLGIVEPWAAFADSPEALAVRGALALDNLVVAPAGNDGPAGPAYGSISGPGGAPAALTVGAADLRARARDARLVLTTGLRVRLDARLPLLGSVVPRRTLTLRVAVPRPASTVEPAGAQAALSRFFTSDGRSLVAGRAALVDGGSDPSRAVVNAARAGAFAVLVYGEQLPPGVLGIDDTVGVPVIGVPAAIAAELAAALRRRADVAASLGSPSEHANAGAARTAGFSSAGLAYDGGLKPNLVGSGVALATSEPGVNADSSPAFGTINGSSAAAATVAGAAALLAEARRGLDAPALRSLLVGSAQPLRAVPETAQGAGLVDVGAAAAAEIATDPITLSFGAPSERRDVRIRNISMRPLNVALAGEPGLAVAPRRFSLPRGGTATVRVVAGAPLFAAAGHVAAGTLRVQSAGGQLVRVPWVAVRRRPPGGLIGTVTLRQTAPRPSEEEPAFLSIRVGRVTPPAEVQAVSRLDIELWNRRGKRLGVLARLRDALPGLYGFGLTGRGPAGQILGRGRYGLRLVAVPTDGGRPTVRKLDFVVGPSTKAPSSSGP